MNMMPTQIESTFSERSTSTVNVWRFALFVETIDCIESANGETE